MGNFRNHELNQLTKESVFSSLMLLMKKKDYNQITITDITKKAGVSRMAYYRNYTSKEDIIICYLDDLFETYLNEIIGKEDATFFQVYLCFFSYFRKQKDLIEALIKANLSFLILDKFNDYITLIFKKIFYNVSSSNLSSYELHYATGGLYKVLIEWVNDGLKESDEEMATIIKHLAVYTDGQT
ncbi:MAG: TetR/AcrR family transcriptional regulator [Oscillospiraceae bacterium]